MENVSVCEKIEALLNTSERIKQTSLAKEIGDILKKEHSPEIIKDAVDKLSAIYITVEQRHPLKKAISSLLQSLSIVGHSTHVSEALEKHLARCFGEYSNDTNSNLSLRQAVDNLAACFDCFPIGAQSLSSLQLQVLVFINSSLSSLKMQLSLYRSPMEMTDLYNLCQQILKIFALFLQEYSDKMPFHPLEEPVLQDIYKLVIWFLEDDLTVLNCRLSSGIALAHLLKATYKEKLLQVIDAFENGSESLVALSRYSFVSQLSFWGGLLASLSATEILQDCSSGHSLLFECIFPKICTNTESKEDPGIFLAQCRILYSWTEKACEVLELCGKNTLLKREKIVNSLLQYVWTVWEHSSDGVRFHGKGIFKNAIRMELLSSAESGDSFLTTITLHLLDMPWHSKGKYSALGHIADVVGFTRLLQLRPSIVDELMTALKESSLAPHVSELVESLSRKQKKECIVEVWQETWLKPLVFTILNGTRTQRNSIFQYVLPRLLKMYPDSVKYILNLLEHEKANNINENSLCATIGSVKAARACRIQFESTEFTEERDMWKNCLPYSTLQLSLFHTDEQVRLDGLGLICDSPKTAEEVSAKELAVLRSFISFNLSVQSPSFRQKALSYVKKLFLRMRDNTHLLLKKNGGVSLRSVDAVITEYKKFLKWLLDFLFLSLHPEVNFPRRGTVLHLLSLLKEIFGFTHSKCPSESSGYTLSESLEIMPHHCQTLLKLVRDTYENNKELVWGLLTDVSAQYLHLQTREEYEELLLAGMSLSESLKPPDSVTAAYLFLLLAKEDAHTSDVLAHYRHFHGMSLPSSSEKNHFFVLAILLKKLSIELGVAVRESLVTAATEGPMYGYLACIRMVLGHTDLSKSMSESDYEKWSSLLGNLVSVSMQIAMAVQPVVCNPSPEGFLLLDSSQDSVTMLQKAILNVSGQRFDLRDIVYENDPTGEVVKLKAVTAQFLLLCCWRSHKEVSVLLGDICQKIVLSQPEHTRFIATEKVIEIGEFFIKQLSEIKHRGAFEQAYIGFCNLCKALWRSKNSLLHNLPKQWLKVVLDSIVSESSTDNLSCPTRRSAGIPFIVQALLVTEPDVTNSRCFKEAMESLLKLSLPETAIYSKVQVHALNILRFLYKDADLGEEVTPYISQGVKSSVLGFKSEIWSVRNSATLLFTTLMTRIFGVNRSREDPHIKNRLTGRVFFSRYPALFDFLLSELKAAVASFQNSQKKENESSNSNLYPILLLLSRLYPSPIEGSDSMLQLGAFVSLVDICSSSPIWWTRHLASRALVPLLSTEIQYSYLESIFRKLFRKTDCCSILPQNIIHGYLLQILNIINNCTSSVIINLNKDIADWLDGCLYLIDRVNPCAVTQRAFLDVVCCILKFQLVVSDELRGKIFSNLDQMLTAKSVKRGFAIESEQYAMTLSRTGLLLALASDDHSVIELVAKLLASDTYEICCLCLDFLSWLLDVPLDNIESRSLDMVPLVRRHDWQVLSSERKSQLRSEILQAKSVLGHLMTMLHEGEEHCWCRAEVYNISCAIEESYKEDWILGDGCSVSNFKKLLQVMKEIQTSDYEDVSVAALHFSAYVAVFIYKEGENVGQLSNEDTAALELWMKCVLAGSSAECSVARRLAASRVLLYASCLMLDRTNILSPRNIPLWKAAVKLLQDDEPIIRDSVSQGKLISKQILIAHGLLERSHFIIPSLYLKMLVEQFVTIFITRHPEKCLAVIIGWCLQCSSNSQHLENKEQAFEKGEMNVFAEDIVLTDIAMAELDRCFSLDSFDKSCFQVLFHDLAKECFSTLKELVDELVTCRHEEHFMLNSVDPLCLKLYQRVHLFKVIYDHYREDFSSGLQLEVGELTELVDQLQKWPYIDNFVFCLLGTLQSVVSAMTKQS